MWVCVPTEPTNANTLLWLISEEAVVIVRPALY